MSDSVGENNGVLPDGWVETTIGTAFELNPRKVPADALPSDAEVTFVPMPAVDADCGTITRPGVREFGAVRKGYTSFVEDDVIVAKITPCMENGKAAIARGLTNGHGFGSSEFHVLRPTGTALPEYVYYFVRQEAFRREAESRMTGSVGQKRVPPSFLGEHSLPLAPLVEQKRIVAKVEALLERGNKARRRLDRVPDILKRFRQSVLAAACSGRLTADWREGNHSEDCAELLACILEKRKERYEVNNSTPYRSPREPRTDREYEHPESWVEASVDQLTCLVTSGSRGWAKYYSDDGPLFVRAQNINTDELRLEEAAHVTPPDSAEGRRTRVQQADLLVTITGANVTKSALVRREIGEAYVSQHVAIARPVDPRVAAFLYLWLVSPAHGRAKLTDDAYGAGKPGLNLDNIRDMPVFLPSLPEQEEIARRVNALTAAGRRIEERFVAGRKRTEKITQSVLAKAFAGELVETEADLARREGRDYEPASVLLERIATERAAASEGQSKRARASKAKRPSRARNAVRK